MSLSSKLFGGPQRGRSSKEGSDGRDLLSMEVDHHVAPWTWLPNVYNTGTLFYAAVAIMAVVDLNQKYTMNVWKWGVFVTVLCFWYVVPVFFSLVMHAKINRESSNPAPANYLNSYWIHCFVSIITTALATGQLWAFYVTFESKDIDVFEGRYNQPAPANLDQGMMRVWYTFLNFVIWGFVFDLHCHLNDAMRPPSAYKMAPIVKDLSV